MGLTKGWATGGGAWKSRGAWHPSEDSHWSALLTSSGGRKSSWEAEHDPHIGSRRQDYLYSWVPTPVWVRMFPSSRPGAQLREGAAEKGFREAGPSPLCGVMDRSWVLPTRSVLKVWTSPGWGASSPVVLQSESLDCPSLLHCLF